MSAEILLDRLESVRQAGKDRWLARCPSHSDKSPSLSIRECSDGTVLIHDFAGCSPADILGAVGLELRDLFPEPSLHPSNLPEHHRRAAARDRRHQHAAVEALRLLAHESLLAALAAENVAAGRTLTDADHARLLDAATRIRAAREVVA